MTLTQFEGMLTTTHERVVAAQAVLAEVERGLAAAERADASVRRARPYLRLAGVVVVGHTVLDVPVFAIVVKDEKVFAAKALPARSFTPLAPPTTVNM